MARTPAKRKLVCVLLFSGAIFISDPLYSWEVKTATQITERALPSVSGRMSSLLREHSPFFRQGLEAIPQTVQGYAGFASFDTTGYAADKLGSQIALFQDLFPSESSPYLAYRLGILANLILYLGSPFATASTPEDFKLRDRFFRDVELNLASLKYIDRPRPGPGVSLKTAIERSDGWGRIVRAQYRAGRGYSPIVQMAASESLSTAVNLLKEVLDTIVSGPSGESEEAGRFEFYRDASDFYLSRGMRREALTAYRKLGRVASSWRIDRIDSLEAAADRYQIILEVLSLEEGMREAGVEVQPLVGEKIMEPFVAAFSTLAEKYLDSGEEDRARMALSICLREKYRPEWTLEHLRKLYALDEIENLEVPENAWKIYLEANGFEAMGDRNFKDDRLWAAHDSYVRAAALYSTIPESVRELRKESGVRTEQVIKKMREIPPAALLSEELFQAAVDSMAEGDIDSAVRGLQRSQQWGVDGEAVGGAMRDAESLRLFMKGKEFYQDGNYEVGAKYFRRLQRRYPQSPFAEPAGKMIELYERRQALETGRLLLSLKGGYEASFLGDRKAVYGLGDEILGSNPETDLRDRAQLLIAVAWYGSNQRGYPRIDRVFRDLLRHQVLKEDNRKLVLKKKIDFYFGLNDPFPEIDLEKFYDTLRARLEEFIQTGREEEGDEARRGEPEEEAEEAIGRARDEIEAAEELIMSGEEEMKDMSEAQSLLEEARQLLESAQESFKGEVYLEAKENAERARDRAGSAKEMAEKILGVSVELREDLREVEEEAALRSEAEKKIEEAESAVAEADTVLKEAEEARATEFGELRADLESAKESLNNAQSLWEEEDFKGAGEKAQEAIDKAKEVTESAEERKKEEEEEEGEVE